MDWYSKQSILFKTASREILYHGTNIKNLQSILSQGLIPNPKQRAWSKDPTASSETLSRKSLEGIYLTNNFMIAKSSSNFKAEDAMRGKGVIVVVQVETRSLVVDEDDIAYHVMSAIRDIHEGFIMNQHLTCLTYIDYKLNKVKDKFSEKASKLLDFILRKIPEQRRQNIKKSVMNLFVDLLESLLVRNMSYIVKENQGYELSRIKDDMKKSGVNFDDIPSAEVGEENFRKVLDVATRKLKVLTEKAEDYRYTARSLEPITFSGSNKILCIVSYENRYGEKIETSRKGSTIVTFHYNVSDEAAKKLLADFRSIYGNVEVRGLQNGLV